MKTESVIDILFDNIVFSLQKIGGISAVWTEMIKRVLDVHNLKYKCIEYNNSNELRKHILIPDDRVIKRSSYFLFIKRFFDIHLYGEKRKFIFHSSYYRICNNKNAINITTVHDFIYEKYMNGIRKHIVCWQKHRAIRKSDFIVCISNNTKADLLKFVKGINPEKIRVIYNGVSENYTYIGGKGFSDLSRFPRFSFLLFVGTRGGYKNFNFAARVASVLKMNFVIVGNELSRHEKLYLDSMLGKQNYESFVRISDYELNILYNSAYCLFYPSSYEGFGIPVVEAQKAGCPVIALNTSSIPEIIGDKTLLLNLISCEEAVLKITMLKDIAFRESVISNGIVYAKRFNWDETFRNLLDLYEYAFVN